MTCLVVSIFFTISLLFHSRNLVAEVIPPNYNFNIDELKPFSPDSNFEDIEKKYGKAKLLFEDKEIRQYRIEVKALRYKFPVVFHVYKNKVLDFHARLPSYFLHDVFHQSLINRFGKQNKYDLKNGTAIYKWKGDTFSQVYSSTCTITCFPVFYTSYKNKYPEPELKDFLPYYFKTKVDSNL